MSARDRAVFACLAANFSNSPNATKAAESWAASRRASLKVIARIETDFWALHWKSKRGRCELDNWLFAIYDKWTLECAEMYQLVL
jgi:hypothetical protein